jgi:hypothetical protein
VYNTLILPHIYPHFEKTKSHEISHLQLLMLLLLLLLLLFLLLLLLLLLLICMMRLLFRMFVWLW